MCSHHNKQYFHIVIKVFKTDGASLLDDPADLVGVCCPQPATPAHNSKEDGTGYNRLVEHPQHDVV